jgi:hypothetical protein
MKSERNSKQLSHQQLSGKATDFAVQDLHDWEKRNPSPIPHR